MQDYGCPECGREKDYDQDDLCVECEFAREAHELDGRDEEG